SARLFEYVPHLNQRCHHRRAVCGTPPPTRLPLLHRLFRLVENPNQVLPVVTRTLLRLIQKTASASDVSLAVFLPNLAQVLLSRVHVHLSSVPYLAPSPVTFPNDPADPFRVTF